jgi:hypothetical protein
MGCRTRAPTGMVGSASISEEGGEDDSDEWVRSLISGSWKE